MNGDVSCREKENREKGKGKKRGGGTKNWKRNRKQMGK